MIHDVPLLVESKRGLRVRRGDRGGGADRAAPRPARGARRPRDDAERRIALQASDEDRRKVATWVVDNAGDLADLEEQIDDDLARARSARPTNAGRRGREKRRLEAQCRESARRRTRELTVAPLRYARSVPEFELVTDMEPAGDQPEAIAGLGRRARATATRFQTLLGITGSGKSFTIANVIAQAQRPTLVHGAEQDRSPRSSPPSSGSSSRRTGSSTSSPITTTTSPRRTSRRPTPTSRRTARSTTRSTGCATRPPARC